MSGAARAPRRGGRPWTPVRRGATALVGLGAVALAGCAVPSGDAGGTEPRVADPDAGGAAPAADAFERRVATDLVAVMMQLTNRSPFATTVQLTPPRTGFGIALGETLRSGGYGVQRVTADQGQHHVRYGVVVAEDERGPLTTYALAVGDVSLERDYRGGGGGPVPASAVRVLGAVPTRVVVNDDVHRRPGIAATFPSGVVFLGPEGEVLERREREVRLSGASARAAGERVETERFLVLARAHLFLGDRLAAEPEPEGTRVPIRQVRLRFADPDSLRLGEPNKRALARLRGAYRAASDRFSVTGCSHGRSLLWDGSESDALARSQRVKEELVLGGVASGRVREEGCFATRYGDELEPGTVIVTLERRANVVARGGEGQGT